MLEIDRSEWLASQFLKETMGSPISRPRQVANTRPCTARAHPFVHQDCSFKTASPVLELTARLVPDVWLRRSAPVTHQDQGFGHSAVMRLACGPWRHLPPQKTLCCPACPIIASLVARAGLVAAGLWGAGARSYYFPQAAIYSNQIMLQRLPIKREQLSIE